MGNKQRKLVPSRQEVTLSRIVDQTGDAGDAVITLPEDLVLAPQDQIVHKIDPNLKISSYTRLAEWKKIKSSAVPFPACYDAVLFTDQTTLFVLAGSTEKGTKSVKRYFGYDFEHKNWYVIDLEEALPAVTLGVRVGDNIYFLSTKNTMLTYNTESHKFVTTPLPFINARELLCAHHVNGEIYVFHAAGDTNDFNSAAVYNIASQEWITKTFGGVKPPERSGFATAVVGDHIYMYAGFRQTGYNADLWRLDTVTLEWHKVEATGNPVGCAGHSLNSMYINGQLYLVAFGGYNGHYLNSAQFLNLNTLEWEVFTCQPINTDTTIGPRTGATAIVINNNLYVVGGYNGPYYNDAYVLKPRALSLKLMCFEYLHRNAKNFTDLSEKLPSDVYEEYRHFV
jgi:hypothetical protein